MAPLALLALGAAAAPAEPLVNGTDHDVGPIARANQEGGGALRPVLGKAVDVSPVSGRVLVKLRGRRGFIPLRRSRTIPVGSLVDTKRGTVALTSARDGAGHTQTGQFGAGLFKVLQGHSSDGLTVLRLWGGGFSACAGARPSSSARAGPRVIRKLRARARRGRFRTRGRYSASTVRGTVWTTIDRCDGTVTKVTRGAVVVRDFRRHLTVVVHAGSSYLARASGVPPPVQRTLSLTKSGTGSGTVTSSPAGIDCGATCSAQFADGTSVTLTAVADPGSSFSGWAGCDSVVGNQCTVGMTADRRVTATFTFSVIG